MLSNYLILCCPFSFCLQSFSAFLGFPGGSDGKESACKVGDVGLNLGLGRFPWRRKWQPPPVFLTRKFHGQRSLEGYSPCGRKELDTTQQLSTHEKIHAKLQFCARKWLSYIKKIEKELAKYRTETYSNSVVFVLEQVRHVRSKIK